ncbi:MULTISPECIES: hypothetical protein [unclassified Embleya]|uniref:hypothetical protein n=1 Tax=unclassified Embleya TaxID=2699296 RepID=UPI0033EE5CA8
MIENGSGSLSEEEPNRRPDSDAADGGHAEDVVEARTLARHELRTEPHPDRADPPPDTGAAPDDDAVLAWCTCLLWRSRLPWSAPEHRRAFDEHLAQVRRAAAILPAALLDGRYAFLPCADEDAALAVAATWVDLGSARSRLFLDGSVVVIAFADVQFPTEVALWALRHDHTDASAVYLLHALEYAAGPRPPR